MAQMKENAIMYNILWQIFKFLPDLLILSLLIIRKAIPTARNISVPFLNSHWIFTKVPFSIQGARQRALAPLTQAYLLIEVFKEYLLSTLLYECARPIIFLSKRQRRMAGWDLAKYQRDRFCDLCR